ncbi:MAG: serine/threonine-protein kinase [Methylicorpusculum sp.]|uniref:serine/threonine protein kinase n=1 Tax=Methylicorpusculum sp. TaxID=2713644 RepID=UPI00271EDF1A|nr:serine/threonine-protein kinase [Methylicorpusculum sp.]MDO8843639.1 serine/threonine-protein kinase [Methylicorpusculum sp.]MDO8939958.1 serine/threonine-protein kinase [Methylicorpusculum sp.]MDP2203013.1 serine/threonine-protein kinase [Methylicorpusculum sp.]
MNVDPSNSAEEMLDDDATRLSKKPSSLNKSASNKTNPAFSDHLAILDIIGEGGVGRVYLAYDETIGRRVAVKELLEEFHTPENPADTEIENSFVHEAKITGKLEHPGIVPVYELGRKADGRPYYAMRYIKGQTLEQQLRKTPQSDVEDTFSQRIKLLGILIDVCNTLAYAHAKGVIHRDLKPGNVISGNFGETIVVDWGLAQVFDDDDNTYFYREALTHQRHTLSDSSSTEVLGTPAYMAPEQFNGMSGKTSDVYSLGIILFRIITGTLPYRGPLDEIEQQIKSDNRTPSPKQFNPSAPPELIAICEKAIHKDPALRFANAGELAEQLKAFRDGRMVNIYAYSKQELLRRFLAQNKFTVIMTALLFLTVAAGAGFSVHYAKQMHSAKTEAEQALSLVTAYGELSQHQAKTVAAAIASKSARLISDMKQAADKISADSNSEQAVLKELHNHYPRFDSFSLRKASEVFSLFSASDENSQAPTVNVENDHLSLIFRSPISENGTIVNYIEAVMYPEKVFPDFFPTVLKSVDRPRDIWIMRSDGLILYDANSKLVGTNLFIDQGIWSSPSLLAFARLTLVEDDSIGYYSFIDGNTEFYKIAAWNSVKFDGEFSWKIIVNYTYLRKDASETISLF